MTATDRKDRFLEKNDKFAKDIVSRTFEVIIALAILLLQYVSCNVPFFEGSEDESNENATSAISDDLGQSLIRESIDFLQCLLVNLNLLEPLKWISVSISACNLVFASVVWVHSKKLNGMNVELTGNIFFN